METTKAQRAKRRQSAGILVYRRSGTALEVFLVHMGGPYWKNKDAGGWSIPKGEYAEGEDGLTAALREFGEETGLVLPPGEFVSLGEIRQAGGKTVTAWSKEADLPAEKAQSNHFTMEWPPKSGRMQEFPEVDRAEWFDLETAGEKLIAGQGEFLERLTQRLRLA